MEMSTFSYPNALHFLYDISNDYDNNNINNY